MQFVWFCADAGRSSACMWLVNLSPSVSGALLGWTQALWSRSPLSSPHVPAQGEELHRQLTERWPCVCVTHSAEREGTEELAHVSLDKMSPTHKFRFYLQLCQFSVRSRQSLPALPLRTFALIFLLFLSTAATEDSALPQVWSPSLETCLYFSLNCTMVLGWKCKWHTGRTEWAPSAQGHNVSHTILFVRETKNRRSERSCNDAALWGSAAKMK